MGDRAASDKAGRAAERVARLSYGKLVSILSARDHDIQAAEDALSEALASALVMWPESGVPDNPEAWLLTAARNRRLNAHRHDTVRAAAAPELIRRLDLDAHDAPPGDQRLNLLFVCAHPAIDAAVRTPLMLQSVLGIDAAAIARAFLVEPAAMAQRLVRAKARIRDTGLRFEIPSPEEMPARLGAVLGAIYAAFSQGWDSLDRPEAPEALTGEAIWLARLLVSLMPEEPEPKGLLALMFYCTARRAARRDAAGHFVPLDRQDATLWDRDLIIEAEGLLTAAARAGAFGRYQCEAAIQSVHIQRPVTGRLNLGALRALYDLLVAQADSIGARIGRAVVLAETGQLDEALTELESLPRARIGRHLPWWVARARIAELQRDAAAAAEALRTAIPLATDPAVQAFLERRRDDLEGSG